MADADDIVILAKTTEQEPQIMIDQIDKPSKK